jgi:hypothetical protein
VFFKSFQSATSFIGSLLEAVVFTLAFVVHSGLRFTGLCGWPFMGGRRIQTCQLPTRKEVQYLADISAEKDVR